MGASALALVVVIGVIVIISNGGSEEAAVTTTTTKPKVVTKSFKYTLWLFPTDKADFTVPSGEPCDGSDVSWGYSDISNISRVTVRNSITEKVIARFNLGSGKSIGSFCAFSTDMKITKGSDNDQGFLFELNDGERGTSLASWEELEEEGGFMLSLGDYPS